MCVSRTKRKTNLKQKIQSNHNNKQKRRKYYIKKIKTSLELRKIPAARKGKGQRNFKSTRTTQTTKKAEQDKEYQQEMENIKLILDIFKNRFENIRDKEVLQERKQERSEINL